MEGSGEGLGKLDRGDGVLAQTQFLEGTSQSWLSLKLKDVWTDDDFGETLETECRDRRHSAVLDVYFLRARQYRSAGARSERSDLGFRILVFEQVWEYR